MDMTSRHRSVQTRARLAARCCKRWAGVKAKDLAKRRTASHRIFASSAVPINWVSYGFRHGTGKAYEHLWRSLRAYRVDSFIYAGVGAEKDNTGNISLLSAVQDYNSLLVALATAGEEIHSLA